MMGGTKRLDRDQGLALAGEASNSMDARGLDNALCPAGIFDTFLVEVSGSAPSLS